MKRRIAALNAMKTAVFDMDGTVLDSMSLWRAHNIEFVRSRGIEPTAQQCAQMTQMSGRMVVDYYREQFGLDTDFDVLCAESVSKMEGKYLAGLPEKPGALDYLRRLGARGVRRVIATATPEPLASAALEKAGLLGELDAVFSVEMIGGSKGEADFYARLADRLGAALDSMVMFEDAAYAMRGARAAGIPVIGVTDATNIADREAIHALCCAVINSFDELE